MSEASWTPHPDGDGVDPLGELEVPASLTGLTCPVCGGVLGEQAEGEDVMSRCRIGHVLMLDAC